MDDLHENHQQTQVFFVNVDHFLENFVRTLENNVFFVNVDDFLENFNRTLENNHQTQVFLLNFEQTRDGNREFVFWKRVLRNQAPMHVQPNPKIQNLTPVVDSLQSENRTR